MHAEPSRAQKLIKLTLLEKFFRNQVAIPRKETMTKRAYHKGGNAIDSPYCCLLMMLSPHHAARQRGHLSQLAFAVASPQAPHEVHWAHWSFEVNSCPVMTQFTAGSAGPPCSCSCSCGILLLPRESKALVNELVLDTAKCG